MALALPNSVPRGKSFWKCNISILRNRQVKLEIEIFLKSAKMHAITPAWWEAVKVQIKDILVRNSVRLASHDKSQIFFMEEQIAEYKKAQEFLPGAFQVEIGELEVRLKNILDKRLEGSKVRSRVQHIDNLEKPTSFFFRRENRNLENKTITFLNIDGIKHDQNNDILDQCRIFYKELLSEEAIDQNLVKYFLSDLPRLSEESRQSCESIISKEEILSSLKRMKNGKCPGSDGLPKEFYTEYIHLFIDEFVKVANLSFQQGILPESLRHGIITLLCKDKSQPEFLKNWRPISLLNVDYKLISKSLTNRISSVLSEVIHIDQTCSVKGRSIQDNLHLLRNISEYVNEKNLKCAIVSIDQTKAFDRVSHNFLFQVLKAFGFGNNFIDYCIVIIFHVWRPMASCQTSFMLPGV
jgi:hypothetical protein